jgi:hypothetical protein
LKKVTAILFFGIYLLATTEAHQLLKLPTVFKHFAEHQQEDKSISFLHFLAIHYTHGSPKDKDYDKDMQLPFKASTDCAFAVVNPFVPMSIKVSVAKPIEIVEKKNYVIQDQCTLSAYLASIWQPPKHC